MTFLRAWLVRLASVIRRTKSDRAFADELHTHLDLHIADNIRAGMNPDDARRRAFITLGGIEQTKEQYRDRRGIPLLEGVFRDLHFGGRMLRRHPGFTAVAILVLGLGIGANNMFFTLVYALCIRGLPIDEPQQVIYIETRDASGRSRGMSYLDFQDLRASARTLTGLGAFVTGPVTIGDENRAPERFTGSYVSADIFRTIGEVPVVGRDFVPEDDKPGAPRVVLLGRNVWQRRYASDPSIVGQTIRVNGESTTVVGVMPDRSKFPNNSEIWQPLAATPGLTTQKRDARTLSMFGRLRNEGTVASADADLQGSWSRLAQEHPDTNSGIRLKTALINAHYVADITDPAWLAFSTAGVLVLVVACFNVANLLLMRSTDRSREMAVRTALGASRGRIVRQLLGESLVLGALGGTLGLVLSVIGVHVIWLVMPTDVLPYWMTRGVDARALAAFAMICLGTSVIFGMVPALHASRSELNMLLKEGGRTGTKGFRARRLTSAFLIAQFALAMVFLALVAMTVRGIRAEGRKDPPIDTARLLTMSIAPSIQKYPTAADRMRVFERIEQGLNELPAVSASTLTSAVPFGGGSVRQVLIELRGPAPAEPAPTVWSVAIGAAYFDTLRVSLQQGRAFTDQDGLAGRETAIVNQLFADTYFPSQLAVGKRVQLKPATGTGPHAWLTIVGISPNIRQRPLPDPDPIVYVPMRLEPPPVAAVIVRGSDYAPAMVPAMREQVRRIDPDLPLYRPMTLDQAATEFRWNGRLSNLLADLITLVAVGLAGVGLFAVTSHAVAQRTQEFGIRVALGAQSPQLIWLVLRRTIIQLALGVAFGIGCVFAFERMFATNSGQLRLSDPQGLLLASAALFVIAVCACLAPFRRATHINPGTALRYE